MALGIQGICIFALGVSRTGQKFASSARADNHWRAAFVADFVCLFGLDLFAGTSQINFALALRVAANQIFTEAASLFKHHFSANRTFFVRFFGAGALHAFIGLVHLPR